MPYVKLNITSIHHPLEIAAHQGETDSASAFFLGLSYVNWEIIPQYCMLGSYKTTYMNLKFTILNEPCSFRSSTQLGVMLTMQLKS